MSVLAWVAFGPAAPRKQMSLYQREIAPNEKKLVWYRFKDKLPEVSPASKDAGAEPVRADIKNPSQTIVARSPRSDPAKQMIFAPGPELRIQRELQAPNLMAFEMPKPPAPAQPPKLFMPPERQPRSTEQPALEPGPEVATTDTRNPLAQIPTPRLPKPEPKAFVPPAQVAKRVEAPQLQPGEARIEPALDQNPLAQIPAPRVPKPEPKAFVPPPSVAKRTEAPQLQSGQVRIVAGPPDSNPLALLPGPARPKPRAFTPPPQAQTGGTADLTLPAAPVLSSPTSAATLPTGIPTPGALPAKPQPKSFTPPAIGTASGPAPALESAPSNLTAAIVGLNPADRAPVIPEGSRPAQFAAAPELSPKGGAGGPVESATIAMADLTIRSGAAKKDSIAEIARVAPTSKENLLAVARPVIASNRPAPPASPISGPVTVSGGPDPRFEGRKVYTVALQMPNVTSFSGSWILWYAEREHRPGEAPEILPPVPLRKVDPLYDLSAAADGVEGKIQLSAVIHSDGYVYGITVLRGLDARLDKNAMTALRKWEFQPARREGAPVDVDVVIEIPFHLRKK